jgi:hypothetical protein
MISRFSVLFFLFISSSLLAQSGLQIISSTNQSIRIRYTPDYSDSSVVMIDNQAYYKINFPGGILSQPQDFGMPAVMQKIITIGVPSRNGNSIEIISSTMKQISGKLVPIPTLNKGGVSGSYQYTVSQNYYSYKMPSEVISFGDFGLMRSIPVQSIIISPIKFDPNLNTITLYTSITFQINYSSNQTIASKPAGDFLDGILINYNVARYWATTSSKSQRLYKGTFNSVLSSGTWYRFEAPQEGIYKITKSMLASYGIDPNTVDPRTIKIYNNGGKILPEDITASRPTDLVENAIMVVGQDDGHFDDNDYILFYAHGTDFWSYDSVSHSIIRYHNPYSNPNYYWITSGGAPGKRMVAQTSITTSNVYNQTTSAAYADWDQDEINIGKTGREYLGDSFQPPSSLSRTYTTKLDGLVPSSTINYKVRFVDASADNIPLEVDEGSNRLYYQIQYGYGSNEYSNGVASIFSMTFNGSLPDNRSLLKFTITPVSASSICYLDYFEIYYQRLLQAVNDNLLFFSKDTNAAVQYNLSGFSSSNIMVFNVSDESNVKLITNSSVSGGQCSFVAQENYGYTSKYFAVGSGNFLTPSNPTQISNSNLHGIQTGAKFIIITNKAFEDAAQRLKNYRENTAKTKISSIVVDIDQIYNEFSCGMVDPTAMRDFIKYAYDNWQITPEYVLFFGKGTYDAKDVEGYHTDFVPTYQTEESLDELNSYTTDDYFVRVSGNDPIIDLAYGRIPCISDEQANDEVDKIISYESNSQPGTWRDLITLVADDGWHSTVWEGAEHTAPSEELANTDSLIPPSFTINKIYLAAYPVVITGAGRRIPEANKAIVSAINNGTLILNYIGHGNPQIWADEQVFVQSTTIPQLNNNNLFFLTAATCDFGHYDLTNSQSGTEALLFLKNAGCIAAFSSSRLVYSYYNHELLFQYFHDLLTTPRDTMNLPYPLGKLTFITKQIYYDVNSQKYELFGDPTVRLGMPQYSAKIDSINGLSSTGTPVQIKALSTVTINGEIRKPDNSIWSDYNGTATLSVFDSQRQMPLPALDNFVITLPGGLLFNGNISIVNGKFKANFVVPKDISYQNQSGKIIAYFSNSTGDGIAYTNNIIVGGTDSTAVNNNIGPSIKIFFDDTTSTNTGLINPNSTLIIKLVDNNGLNTTGTGVGHKLEGILNDQTSSPIDFTNYFVGDLNSGGKSGEVLYRFNGLDPGDYKLKVTAWDVFNNASSQTVFFTVVSSEGLVIKNIYNYPDPFAYNTTFTFQQNLTKPIDVKIKIYSIAGRLIREIDKNGINEKFVKISWDGRDQDGDLIANGAYLYKVIVETVDGQYSQSAYGKLAIIR